MDILCARYVPTEPAAAYLAVVYGHEGRRMPWAIGDTREAACAIAMRQAAGVSPTLQAHYAERLRTLPLTAEQADAWRAWFALEWADRGDQPAT